MKSKKVLWGGMLIVIGIIALLFNFGILGIGFLQAIISLWPLFIVAAGIGMIFRPNAIVQLLIWVVVVAVIVYFGIFGSHYEFLAKNSDNWTLTFPLNMEIAESEVFTYDSFPQEKARLEMVVSAGQLLIESSDDNNSVLSVPKNKTTVELSQDESVKLIQVKNLDNSNVPEINLQNVYDVSLDNKKEWSFDITGTAVEGHLDLTELFTDDVIINTAAGDINIAFGELSDLTHVTLNGAASDVYLEIPEDIGVRIIMSSVVSDVKFNGDFDSDKKIYTSKNYKSATKKIEIVSKSALTSLYIDHN